MQRRTLIQALTACTALPLATQAQVYPARPVRIINPFAAGGALDQLARLLAQQLTPLLGQPFLVENRTGAGGNIGAEYVAKSPADGYTLVMGSSATHGINPSLYGAALPFDPVKDFATVSVAVVQKNVLVVNSSVPAHSVLELISMARAQPGKLTFGSAGAGTSQHLSGELFKALAKVDLLHVPYKGSAQAMQDLLGGQVTMLFVDIPTALAHIRSGRLRALGLTAAEPSPALPEVQPLARQGLPDFDLKAWYGVLAPAGTPVQITSRVSAAVVEILRDAKVREHLLGIGMEPLALNPDESARYLSTELRRWADVVRLSGAKI
ncbi:Bug family tripartite tricarboxylate transporter substrate binding protein [Xylophilus sp. ASV27]|uniref:Bug family tripartite tricarboxylate transporter substrate binding protein n=1 Tax=Xylophilus sp. ASV27 TaxID=2795129 RepID=UPI0018ED5F1A|nr:tripartite tricarboxylate transporter substrate binding protein [Xylophilus sp. ASV27]